MEGSHWLDPYQHSEAKVYDFSSRDKSCKRYVYVGSGNNGRIKVIFEPSEKMLDNMYNYSPSKVKKGSIKPTSDPQDRCILAAYPRTWKIRDYCKFINNTDRNDSCFKLC